MAKKKNDGENPPVSPEKNKKSRIKPDPKVVSFKDGGRPVQSKELGKLMEAGLPKTFSRERELCERIHDLCHEYGEEVGVAGVIGCLKIVSMTIWSDQFLTMEEEE